MTLNFKKFTDFVKTLLMKWPLFQYFHFLVRMLKRFKLAISFKKSLLKFYNL